MNYAEIKNCDIANGPGVRVSLFVSGCTHRCPDCFNAEAWDFSYGNPFTEAVQDQLLEYLRPDYIKGLTLLGGEPLELPNQHELLPFLKRVRTLYPNKNIWCYTGYVLNVGQPNADQMFSDSLQGSLFREIPQDLQTKELLSMIDVLVDGPFLVKQKDISLRFRGSKNQRLIDLKASLAQSKVILWEEDGK